MPGVGRPAEKPELVGLLIGAALGASAGWILGQLPLFAIMGALIGFLAGGIRVWIKARADRRERTELRKAIDAK